MAFQELEDTTRKLLKRVGAVEATANGPTSWGDLTSVPAAFPPSAHTLASHTGLIANTQLPGRLQEDSSYRGGGDANTFVTNGWYRGSGVTNAPTADWYYFEVIAASPWIYQKAIRLHTDESWHRWKRNEVWTAWARSYDSAGSISWFANDAINAHKGIPFAMAAGLVASVSGSFVTVTFPSGRFSVPPIVTAQMHSGAGGAIGQSVMVTNVTKTGFITRIARESGVLVAAGVFWNATQMASGAAAG